MYRHSIAIALLINLPILSRDVKSEFYAALNDDAAQDMTVRFGGSFLIGLVQGVANGHFTKDGKNAAPLYATTEAGAHVANGLVQKRIIPKPLDLWALGAGEVIGNVTTTHLSGKKITPFTLLNANLCIAAAGTGLWFFQKITGKK